MAAARPTRGPDHPAARNPSPLMRPLGPPRRPATLVGPTTLTYQDVDGDAVTVTLSKPLLTSTTVAGDVFTFDTGGVGGTNATPQQLQAVDLTRLPDPAAAAGVSVRVSAAR